MNNNPHKSHIMRKQELINRIHAKTNINKVDILLSIESAMSIIKDATSSGDEVFLRGFGTFTTKHRKGKPGRNIKKGTSLFIEPHNIPFFKPAPDFSRKVKQSKQLANG